MEQTEVQQGSGCDVRVAMAADLSSVGASMGDSGHWAAPLRATAPREQAERRWRGSPEASCGARRPRGPAKPVCFKESPMTFYSLVLRSRPAPPGFLFLTELRKRFYSLTDQTCNGGKKVHGRCAPPRSRAPKRAGEGGAGRLAHSSHLVGAGSQGICIEHDEIVREGNESIFFQRSTVCA